MDTSIYIPTNSVGGFPFAPHSCHCLLVIVLMIAILTGVRWYFIVVLIGIPYDQWCWASFHMHVGHPYFFFWKNSIQVSSQFFWLSELFRFCFCFCFLYWAVWAVYIFCMLLLLLLSRLSRVRLCATPQTAAHQTPLSLAFPGKKTGVGCHFLLQCMKVKSEVAQLCPTLSNSMDYSLPGSYIHGTMCYWRRAEK